MKAAVLDATAVDSMVVTTLQAYLVQRQIISSWYALKTLKLLPCRSCGLCGTRTPGECFQNDDMQRILRSMAASELLIYITPITFGGYSSLLKKAIDRTMPLGEPLYFVRHGHLLHPMRYGEKYILAIGFSSGDREEEENFTLLVARNAFNMQCRHDILLIRPEDRMENWSVELGRILSKAIPS